VVVGRSGHVATPLGASSLWRSAGLRSRRPLPAHLASERGCRASL